MAYRKSHLPNFTAISGALGKAARETLVELVDEYAEAQRDEFVARIEAQRFMAFRVVLYPEGTNLSPQWIARKDAAGADLRTMIATGHYIESINVFRNLKANKGQGEWRIGFHPNNHARNLDGSTAEILLNDVAMVHEHGNLQTPARPHWGPNYNRMKREAPKLRKAMKAKVKKAMKKVGGKKVVVN